ncbi:MAG: LuxR C-terminal-related transcriptional regulator [Alphaproteobacteria bacterium]
MAVSASACALPARADQPWLAAALEHLPVAIGLVERAARFVERFGALRDMLGETIPSRPTLGATRWLVNDEWGAPLDPRLWPSERALRGETVLPGAAATFLSGEAAPRAMRISAAPINDPAGIVRSVMLIQDADPDMNARVRRYDHLETRFAEAMIGSVRDAVWNGLSSTVSDTHARIERTMSLPAAATPSTDDLTQREDQVLKLLAWGVLQKEVGARLGVSVKTVEFHRARAARKLNLRSRLDLVRYAARRGWFVQDIQ